ncbi:MAG: 2,3-bisphosphoglycerate-independent phosphoglycerate mutase [Polyangiaceae bacterium]|jgi:2,3-bisphosphoglycerate-independent phosphoglycerate mutase
MNSTNHRPRPVVLVVIDGLAERDDAVDGAVRPSQTPKLSSLEPHHLRGAMTANGSDRGLVSGLAGKTDLGLIGLSAGREISTELARIDRAVRDDTLAANLVIRRIIGQAKDFGGRLHLIGLLSDGGVHSSLAHLFGLIEVAKKARVRVVVHALLDGRDVAPRTAPQTIAELESKLANGIGRIGTVGGRFWGMDCDNRWERVQKSYRAIIASEVYRADSALRGIEQSYEACKTDEIVEPFVVFDYPGVSPVDTAIHFNFRPEGARELTWALASSRFDHFARKGGRAPFAGRYACLTTHDASLDLPVAFPHESYPNLLPELLARAGHKQFRCAGTAKYADVTSVFNGGREEPFVGEDRKMISSIADMPLKDKERGMAACVAQATEAAIRTGKYDFFLVHLGSLGWAGCSGASSADTDAVDAALGRVLEAARSVGGAVLITGDPAGLDWKAVATTAQPPKSVRPERVPVICINDSDPGLRIREGGRFCDLAPTLLDLLELPQPAEMTGLSLLDRR